MKREDKQQFTLRITRANATELVVILYEMMLCYLEDGKAALAEQNDASYQEALRHAGGCLNELINSLRPEYEPAPALQSLYLFCVKRLALAGWRKDESLIEEIERVIVPLKDAYRQISAQNSAGPVMNNSQTVYAGLTYGRHALTENMTDQGANRGMFA